jgi:pimeloyl-ACP methyl ester carboxylesterase
MTRIPVPLSVAELPVAGARIAVMARPGAAGRTGFFWLGGWRSDMTGAKAVALDAWCEQNGHACCRFDYSGHGRSSGDWRDGTISRWLAESLAVFDTCAPGPQALVGSSMGGWIALRMAQEIRKRGEENRIAGLLLIAPAPDFTRDLILPGLSARQRGELARQGHVETPSAWSGEPNRYSRALIDDGDRNLVLAAPLDLPFPVAILQGAADAEVPADHALKLAALLPQARLSVTLVPDGDHRLSRPQDIALMLESVASLVAPADESLPA